MNRKKLFLSRFEELNECLQRQSDRDMLNLSLVLRQFLFEGLINEAAKESGEKIKFTVGYSTDERANEMLELGLPAPDLHFLSIFPPNESKREIDIEKFLTFKTVSWRGEHFSVHDVIGACANILGGVHLGKPRVSEPNQQKIVEMGEILEEIGANNAFSCLILIGNVVRDSLNPIVIEMRRKQNQS